MSDFEDFLIDFIEDNKSSKLIVDKKEYSITSTKEIRIEDDSIYINGDKIKIEANDSKINITIIGNIENLNINRCNNFKVEGNIKTVLFPIICDSLVGNIEKVNGAEAYWILSDGSVHYTDKMEKMLKSKGATNK